MSDTGGLVAFRFPASPYPGLRPFLDHEAALFLGRGRQIGDVVRRLTLTQFVAVVGGSGSGKSSLVRAGVVPKLRGYGIPDAGDYWVPVVFTPGTTAMPTTGEGIGDANVSADQTPITRLAWKFSQQLEKFNQVDGVNTMDAERESARRLEDIANIFRRGTGFARLVDAYTEDLPAVGPDRDNARFLFIIDQFEELFHLNNKGRADTRILIEAVIDHFFSPHPRCFVILTMRSEHLADCAGYLELPDAINESVYLVRRPDEGELREAIAGPAKAFLRLLLRGDGNALPEDIVFDDLVVQRLLKDVERIADDPDHLPLLQHLLARLWEVASARCRGDGRLSVPNEIQWGDLERGVDPKSREFGWLRQREDVNALRASLENWAKATYEDRSDGERKHIDLILRRLAFKDPNNGTYNQQHLDVNDLGLFSGDGQRQSKLRDLIEKGYLDSVHYLHWDKENPARVTLKVSHESFIRGWSHFRELVDREAERFEEFLTVLRRCADWLESGRPPKLLLGQTDLIRLEDAGLGPVFTLHDQREVWFRTLKQFRDGERLGVVETKVAHYIASSRARLQAEAEAKRLLEERERKAWAWIRKLLVFLGVPAILLLVAIPFLVTFPVMFAIEEFGRARLQVDQRLKGAGEPILGAAGDELVKLLEASDTVLEGKRKSAYIINPTSRQFSWLPQVALAQGLVFLQDTESYVNAHLRRRLTTGMWHSDTNPESRLAHAEIFDPGIPLKIEECTVKGKDKPIPGVLYRDATQTRRGIFIPRREPEERDDIELYPAYSNNDKHCQAGEDVGKAANSPDAYVLFDARVRFAVISRGGSSRERGSVNLFKINWDDERDLPTARLELLTQVIGDNAVAILRDEFTSGPEQHGDPKVKSVVTWREVGGIGARVGNKSWRFIDDRAQRIQDPGSDGHEWMDLDEASKDSDCALLNNHLSDIKSPDFKAKMYQAGRQCFHIQVPDKSEGTPEEQGPTKRIVIGVYDAPVLPPDPKAISAPIATIKEFASSKWNEGTWLVGAKGERFEGWIASRRKDDGEDRLVGTPWSTAALAKLGRDVVDLSKQPLRPPQNPQTQAAR